MKTETICRFALVIVASVFLNGCDNDDAADASRRAAAQYREWVPMADNLADKYRFSCKACHTDPNNADAPQAGDRVAWAEYLTMDRTALMQRVIDGYEGMPPLGQCSECNGDDLNALIDFMADPEQYGRAEK